MRNSRTSRFFAWLLTLVMVFNMTPVTVFAAKTAEDTTNVSEYFDDTFELEENAVSVTSEGTGASTKVSIAVNLEGEPEVPDDVSNLGFVYTLPEGQEPVAANRKV